MMWVELQIKRNNGVGRIKKTNKFQLVDLRACEMIYLIGFFIRFQVSSIY